MPFSSAQIELSYRRCREVCRRAHSNFTRGFRFVPRDKRRAMEALYAFMRKTDDLVDFDLGDGVSNSSQKNSAEALAAKKLRIAAWRESLRRAVEEEKVDEGADGSELMPAVADAVRRFSIPVKYFSAAIDGVEMDLEKTRYANFAELEAYCERVASAVGLACVHIWGFKAADDAERSRLFEAARATGVAFQLTNVLRDVAEDAAAGRIYVPQEDLTQFNCTEENFRVGAAGQEFLRLMDFEITLADDYYRRGAELVNYLHVDGRRLYCVMFDTYRTLLKKIAADPAEVLRRRIRLTPLEKLRCAVRGFCGVGFSRRLKNKS